MLNCIQRTQGGKGNEGMFIERDPKGICAAGMPTAQPEEHTGDQLKHYLLQDEIDSLISDAIMPEPKSSPIITRRRDMRNAGVYTDVGKVIRPPVKTKFEDLSDEIKSTAVDSYWKKPLGKSRDLVPFLPPGYDIQTEISGRKTVFSESVYDLVTPKVPYPSKINASKEPGYQTDRHYSRPAYDPKRTFGIICSPDKTGIYAKCCLSVDRIKLGKGNYAPITVLEADTKALRDAHLALSKSPNENISCVPAGYAFGELKPSDNVPKCLTTCKLNTGREEFLKCLSHLNTLRKCLSKRFDSQFFRQFLLRLKYLDKDRTGWLPKDVVYDYCSVVHVRVNPAMIEPLLEIWNGFDGTQIQYEVFVHVINYKEPSPGLPKIPDIEADCLEFSTTYNDMVKPGQGTGMEHMAGLPSGRYFDTDYGVTPEGCCKAIRICLPDESDAMSCVNPSNYTHFGINHRDMYAKRTPEQIRDVFEAAGEKFTNEKFNELWDEASKYHSEGWVSFETFKRVLFK